MICSYIHAAKVGLSDVSQLGAAKISESFCSCCLMTTTPNPNANNDLTKPTNVGESTCQLLIVPHVPLFNAVRKIVRETSTVLVNQTNLIRVELWQVQSRTLSFMLM